MRWFSRIRALFGRERLADEHEEELQFHLAMREQWNVERGLPHAEARRDARIRFGSLSAWRERMSEIDLMILPQTVLQDLRYGARMLVRNVGFTSAAVLALAIGIGANTAAYTAYKAFFKRPLEGRDTGRLVNVALNLHSGETLPVLNLPDYEAYRNNVHAFSGLTASSNIETLTLTGAGGVTSSNNSGAGSLLARSGLLPVTQNTELASVHFVANNYFSVLGAGALRGRTFEEENDQKPASALLAMISENYWQKRFGGDASVLGKTFRLNGIPFTIVGITQHNFVGTNVDAPDFWLPMSAEPMIHPGANWLRDRENQCCRLFARLAPGATIAQAQAEMSTVADNLRSLHAPNSDLAKPVTALVWPGSPFPLPLNQFHGLNYVLMLILIAVGMVLLIACANVACLQLARAASRQSELAMRLSLGASRFRMIRQLLTESALLGVIAGSVALLFSWAFLEIVVVAAANAFPAQYGTFIFHVTPDLGIFAYVFFLSLLASVLFGLAPALESSRAAVSSSLKANIGTSPARSRRLRETLMAIQVAISLMLLIAGSMLIRSSIRALKMDTGYDSKRVLSLELQFPEGTKYNPASEAALARGIRTRLEAVAGVAEITGGLAPDGGGLRTAAVSLTGEKPSAKNTKAVLYYRYIQANYFHTLGIPLLFGRTFQSQAGEPEPVVILSESAVRQLWPGENPIGRSLRLGTDGQFHTKDQLIPDGRRYEVIGVSRDTRGVMMDGGDSQVVYMPMPEDRMQNYPILIRTKGEPAQYMNAIAAVLAAVDPDVVVSASTLEELLLQTPAFAASSMSAAIATSIGLLGLLLASMGIYGTVSYMVVLRTREVGIRMALGARRRDVLILMLRESTQPVIAGLVTGMVLSLGVSHLLRKVLYGLNAIDAVSLVGVAFLFLTIALLASYLPSRRAMRVDPVVALRYE
jgi:predicted permease